MKPKPENLGELIRQINDKGSQRAALFCAPPKSGAASRAQPDEVAPAIDQEKRTVQVAFATETEEVERWYGIEVLVCTPEAVDLSRLNAGAPVLDMHDRWLQVGVVDAASVDSDHVARATLRYSRSTRGEELLQDIVDGIRTKVSVGYRVLEMKLVEERDDGPDVYHVTRWQPYEISNVSIPADNGAEVGRSAVSPEAAPKPPESNDANARGGDRSAAPTVGDSPATPKNPETRKDHTMDPKEKARLQEEARKQGGADNQARVDEILDTARQYGASDELVRSMIKDQGKTADDLARALLEERHNAPATRAEDPSLGMSEKEVKQFSFLRALDALANPNDRRAQEAAAFEFECSSAAQERSKRDSAGILVPVDVLKRSLVQAQRDLTVGTATAGGHTVATDLLGGSFIELLRNRALVMQMATVLTDLNGNIAIPRQSGGASAYWVGEGSAPAESQQAFDQVTLSPNTLAGFTDYSRKLFKQSSIDIEAMVRGDLARVLALEIDRAAINGSGTGNEPLGILNFAGIGSVVGGANGAAPTWGNIVDLETEVAVDNADLGALRYLTNARARGKLKKTEKAANTANFIWSEGNELNGYMAMASNQVPSDLTKGTGTDLSAIIFGNFADLLIGLWGGLDLQVNPYSLDTQGLVRVTAHQECDTAVRHAESFAAMKDAITT